MKAINIATTHYERVREFMTFFGQETPTKIALPSLEVRRTRAKLILEEALEKVSALGFEIDFQYKEFTPAQEPNLVKLVDGICDIDYVNKGTAIACGIPETILALCFREVHRSNMTKLWKENELFEAQKKYPFAVCLSFGEGLYKLILDGKVIKSPSYSPANLEQFLKL